VNQLRPRTASPEHDPALLAYLKCHVTSFTRWDVLRLMVNFGERWTDAQEAARVLHKCEATIEATLRELVEEGLVEAGPSRFGVRAYRMSPLEPSTLVAERLVQAAQRSHELRELIVARILGATRIAS
jgi:DNA-binding MarR family transcriptional regulator